MKYGIEVISQRVGIFIYRNSFRYDFANLLLNAISLA